MSRIPDLDSTPTDQIQYLVQRRFPLLSWYAANSGRTLERLHPEADSIQEIQRAADEYRKELVNKPAAELKELVAAELRKEAAAAQARTLAEERKRFYNQPNAVADFEHWSKCAHWTIDEAVALSLGKAPEIVTKASVKPYLNVSSFAKDYMRRYDLAMRAIPWKRLFDPVLPSLFLAWARRVHIDVHPELTSKVESLGIVIADWQDMCEQQRKTIDALTGSLAALKQEVIERQSLIEALLQQRDAAVALATALEAEAWDGFDVDADDYPEELDLAFSAWRAVHNARDAERSPKDQIADWLDKNAPEHISAEAKKRISVTCNWKKGGGAATLSRYVSKGIFALHGEELQKHRCVFRT